METDIMHKILFSLVAVLVFATECDAQPRDRGRPAYPPKMPGAKVEVYKKIGDDWESSILYP